MYIPYRPTSKELYLEKEKYLTHYLGNIVAKTGRYKIQEALFNVGSHVNFITLAHLTYFPTNKRLTALHRD